MVNFQNKLVNSSKTTVVRILCKQEFILLTIRLTLVKLIQSSIFQQIYLIYVVALCKSFYIEIAVVYANRKLACVKYFMRI